MQFILIKAAKQRKLSPNTTRKKKYCEKKWRERLKTYRSDKQTVEKQQQYVIRIRTTKTTTTIK